jgi:Holliday junction DNA helicase RuvB
VEIIGNEDFIRIVELSKQRQPFPHTLIYGPSGAGKTTLAKYISSAINASDYMSLYAPELEAIMLSMMLTSIEENSLIVIDEIHALKKGLVEQIYQPIEEFIYGGENIPPFTLIGITTDLNMLPDAFVRRFRLKYRVTLYTVPELAQVVSGLTNQNWSNDAIEAIANMSRGSPGLARNNVELIESMYNGDISDTEILEYMKLQHIDILGLEEVDIDYMKVVSRFDALALSTISSLLSEREKTIEENIEPYLFRCGFVMKTSKGRVLTPRGKSYIRNK